MKAISRKLWAGLLCAAALPPATVAAEAPSPDADNPAYTWDLTDLYPTAEAWAAERGSVEARADSLAHYAGTLGKGAPAMLKALDAISGVWRQYSRLASYASLRADEDVNVAANQERKQAVDALGAKLATQTAWLTPEIIAVGAAKVAAFERQSPELKRRFGHTLDNALRNKPHTLSAEGEGIMAAASQVLAQPNITFSQLFDGELPWPTIKLSTGEEVKLDEAGFDKYRNTQDRDDRRRIYETFLGALGKYNATFGTTLTTQVMAEEFDAKVRHFPDALADATFADNMPESVYRMLVAEANRNLPTLQRFLKIRRAALGIQGKLQYYDLYPDIFEPQVKPHYSVADMKRLTLEATAPYGPEYAALLRQGIEARWMSLFPRPGKHGGAYMNGSAYDVHPYLLFNNHDDYESLSTFAHEWGHAVHTRLTHANQPYETANYSTFTAETASIANEMLLNDYLVAHATNDADKLFYLAQAAELISNTFYLQVMFADFQLAIHEEVEKGGTLSGERMSDIYCGLVKRYFGEAEGIIDVGPEVCVGWSRVPHFYYGFYVYQYATSMAGAAHFVEAIGREGAPARERFIAMLKAGGSDYPYEIYRKAGLDMATPEPYEALVARMNRIMDEIEAIQRKH